MRVPPLARIGFPGRRAYNLSCCGWGWDFRPPGGESPAEMAARLRPALADAARAAACLLVLQVVSEFKKSGIRFSSLLDEIKIFESSGERNYTIQNNAEAMLAVRQYFEEKDRPASFFDFDGYRMEYPDWWFNIRPSNTEPYLRLIVEANTPGLLAEKVQEIELVLKQFE